LNNQILSRKTVFKGHAFDVQKLTVRLPDQRERLYDLVAHHNSATIIPLDDSGNIWFVTQFRMGSEKILMELPAGVIDEGEEPENCALREIREEIGMAADKIRKLGAIYLAPGYSNELNYIFLATGLKPAPLAADEDEFLGIKQYPLEEIDSLISKGKLIDSKSISALYLARDFLIK